MSTEALKSPLPSSPQSSPAGRHQKRSFLKLPAEVDVPALLADYRAIPADAWKVSHWEIHCSSAMVLLRGGSRGTEEDFTTREVSDTPILRTLPYLSRLLGPEGPFGQATYAFIFRMKPMGVSQPHVDDDVAWHAPWRIHIPLTTNDDAHLLSEGRSVHFEVGEVWTFDNQVIHAVTNGPTVRAHLIFDVPENPKLDALLGHAHYVPGQPDPKRWARAALKHQPIVAPLRSEPLSVGEKQRLGLNPEGFASRVTDVRWIGRLSGGSIRRGDILHSVNGVDACEMARTATDYLQLRHQPGETVRLGVLRGNVGSTHRVRLFRNVLPPGARRAIWQLKQLRHLAGMGR